jgi:hypothetical protein
MKDVAHEPDRECEPGRWEESRPLVDTTVWLQIAFASLPEGRPLSLSAEKTEVTKRTPPRYRVAQPARIGTAVKSPFEKATPRSPAAVAANDNEYQKRTTDLDAEKTTNIVAAELA